MADKTPAEIIESAVKMDKRVTDMERQLAATREVFPWELIAAVNTGELDPKNEDHAALMHKFVHAITTPESDYYKLYRKDSKSGFEMSMKLAAEAILKFYGLHNDQKPKQAAYKFFLQVSTTEVYRVIVTMSEDIPVIKKEELTL